MDKVEYFAFISYQRKDEEWAKWLAHELEHYRFPVTINGREDIPKELRPIFRDIDELSAGNLPRQIHNALKNSKHLIVICSTNSVKSKWVNKEIEEFISMGKTDKIFPFIIDGKAFSENEDEECFPPALKNLPKEEERLGGNINELGRDAAVVKIIAGMLNLSFDTLWQRYEREKAEEERKIREQRNHLLRVQSRFLSEKAINLIEDGDSHIGRLLALAALPENIEEPERPYVAEAEYALRYADHFNSTILHLENPANEISSLIIDSDGDLLATLDNYCGKGDIKIWNLKNGTLHNTIPVKDLSMPLAFSSGNKKLYLGQSDRIIQMNIANGQVSTIKKEEGEFFISISKDSKKTISINQYKKEFKVWNLETKRLLCMLAYDDFEDINHWKSIPSIIFNEKGNLIAGTFGYSTYIWNIEHKKLLFELKNKYDDGSYLLISAAYSPNGLHLATGDQGGNIRLWNISTGELVATLAGDKCQVRSVTFNSKGTKIISASIDGTIRIWNANSFNLEKIFNAHNHTIEHIIYNSANDCVLSISKDKTIRIWDIDNQSPNFHIVDNYKLNWTHDHTICPKGEYYIEPYCGVVLIKCLNSNLEIDRLKGNGYKVQDAAYSPEGKFIATGVDDGFIRIWDVMKKNIIKELELPSTVWQVEYNHKGNYIAAHSNESIYIIDFSTDTIKYKLEGHKNRINGMSYSCDDKLLASYSKNEIIIWDISSGTKLAQMYDKGNVINVKFSNDRKFIVSTSMDSNIDASNECDTIGIWDVDSGTLLECIRNEQGAWLSFLTEDNKKIVAIIQEHNEDVVKEWEFMPLQKLIDQTKEVFTNRQLTAEDKKKYYLE